MALASSRSPFTANLRARIEAYEEGFVKIWVRDNTVVAAQALGHNVSEMIQGLANMMPCARRSTTWPPSSTPTPPTRRSQRTILERALGKAIEVPNS